MVSPDVHFAEALHCLAGAEVVQLEQLAYLDLPFLAFARNRFSCSLNSGLSASPKSSGSNTWRISTSPSWNGARFSHSMASLSDFTSHSQKPAISSFVSAKGPSITVRLLPENLTRAPLELACSPSPASITPAFSSWMLNFPISVRIFSSGRTPASESLLALTSTMTLIVVSSFVLGSTYTTGEGRRDRQGG